MKATLSVDHRVSDGAETALFMPALPKELRDRCGRVPGTSCQDVGVNSAAGHALSMACFLYTSSYNHQRHLTLGVFS